MAGPALRKMKRVGIPPGSESARAYQDRHPEPTPEGPRFGDVMFEIGVVLALHLAFAFAVVTTLSPVGGA